MDGAAFDRLCLPTHEVYSRVEIRPDDTGATNDSIKILFAWLRYPLLLLFHWDTT
jgi:hypothetical protein